MMELMRSAIVSMMDIGRFRSRIDFVEEMEEKYRDPD